MCVEDDASMHDACLWLREWLCACVRVCVNRLAIAHAINLRRRTVLFDGQVPSPDALASLPLAVKAPS